MYTETNLDLIKTGIGSEFGLSRIQKGKNSHFCQSKSGQLQAVANGRAALRQAIRSARACCSSSRSTFLLPAYLCHSMVQPFLEESVDLRFYRVTEELQVDPSDLVNKIDNTVAGILWVHYFGFPQASALANRLGQFPDLFVIEDSTHSWLTRMRYCGDVTIISPRKMLPLPDLAWVVYNSSRAVDTLSQITAPEGIDWRFAISRSLALLLRGIYFRWPVEICNKLAFWLFQHADGRLDREILVRGSSRLSRWLFSRFPLDEYANCRRHNFQQLLAGLADTNHIKPLYTDLPSHVIPLGFPILTGQRDWVKAQLIEAKIYPPIHWMLPPQIDLSEFPISRELMSCVLTIPIDQRYGSAHMKYVIQKLHEIDSVL